MSKPQEATVISNYVENLILISEKIKTIEGLLEFENQLRSMQQQIPPTVADATATVYKTVFAKPDNSAEVTAREFITIAQERLQKYQAAKRTLDQKTKASDTAQTALKVFSDSVEETLGGLYSQVESKLADYYCFINHDDEAQFKAKLEHKEAALNLEVDFHNRGLFPPGAYHSEGHQDGMGICLYLALMQQQLQDDFTFVVLDDVVMSVDTQHRREVCRLFDEKFPNTQFILTTHEQAWHRQMHSQGLISRKASVSFRNWTVEHGPLVAASPGVWEDIDKALQNEDVPAAAAKLRRHLEYVAQELAESLRAQVTFQGDGNYDLGGLLQPALSRVPKYLKEAKKVAISWKDSDAEQTVQKLIDEFESKSRAVSLEQWASINPAVHYNPWANFSKEDFLPVVESYKALLSLLRCEKCETWLCVSPAKGNVESLRCACMRTNFNLRKK